MHDISVAMARMARPSGAFAMLAIDQREGLRVMMAEHQLGPVADETLTEFKLEVIEALSPYASAVLIDRELAWEQALAAGVTAPSCALIAAADTLVPGPGELVASVEIDRAVEPAQVRAQGAVALKLLVLWRPDEPVAPRIAMVDEFIAVCHAAGLASVVEPVTRRPRDGGAWDREAAIIAAARELGRRGQDLYKCEVPLLGAGSEADMRRAYAAMARHVQSPWVVLSSGVKQDEFPQAVEWACREGGSGFLAGRGIWSGVIGRRDMKQALREDAVPRLERLCSIVDRVMA
ncbi:MAG: aldolase [Rhodospirillales bacterium 20-60-12]|nr:MAG: aldolase [Rhodospirillales bacterium 20-60-12]